ncbi:hypothetical protein FNU76_16130 [Chitinimonas arctica]|uniref:Carboxypeptidase regulatory-like domain-containing protein n=1 Tax=Chitinimonas arctica TaxID=2594795 RepID=A0A516SHY9_9NEIS|nr:hypothetical protein [Chitinimonas arctica]QDQ27753.1 hypothetical protein FNU76_16130 [Chitinimonas arctica]
MAEAPTWQSDNGVQYLCGGVGDDNMQVIKAERQNANVDLKFIEGARGAYVADVDLTVSGDALPQPLRIHADGPSCLLQLPTGRYQVVADYQGVQHAQGLRVGEGSRQLTFRW